MRTKYNKEFNVKILVPETPIEAVEQLLTFFEADMWYSKNNGWKTEKDMLKYLHDHFNICIKQIKGIEEASE